MKWIKLASCFLYPLFKERAKDNLSLWGDCFKKCVKVRFNELNFAHDINNGS